MVLRGSVASFIFNDRGEIAECAVIDPQQGVYGFDIPAGEWHSLLVLESGTVVYEVKPARTSRCKSPTWRPGRRAPAMPGE